MEKEGFIVIRQGLGTFVAPMNVELLKEEKQKELEENILNACKIARLINLDESELVDLVKYIYEGEKENE